MMWWNHGAWGAGDWFAMSFMMIVFWALLIALIGWLIRSGRRGRDSTAGLGTRSVTPRADEVLAERFAHGEIDADEFGRRRALLHDDPPRP
ncbi:MAG: SHOCT domain-containing protein [Nakamurella sp.]